MKTKSKKIKNKLIGSCKDKKVGAELIVEQYENIGNKFVKVIQDMGEKMSKNDIRRMEIENSKDNISINTEVSENGTEKREIKISFSKETSQFIQGILKELKAN